MPRGGARPGAGRKRKVPVQAPAPVPAEPVNAPPPPAPQPEPHGYTPHGEKAADAPERWPFGTQSEPPPTKVESPLDLLLSLVRDEEQDMKVRLQAAAIAAPFVHAKPAPVGKKDAQRDAAKKANRFAASPPPLKLVAR